MKTKILIAGVAIAALAVGGASAATHHKKMHHKMHKSDDMAAASSKYAAPDQPIPYAQLDSYLDSHGMGGSDMGAMKSSGHMKMSKKSMKHHGKMGHHKMKGSDSSGAMATPDNGAMSTPPATPDSGAMATPPAATPDTTTPSTPPQ